MFQNQKEGASLDTDAITAINRDFIYQHQQRRLETGIGVAGLLVLIGNSVAVPLLYPHTYLKMKG